MAAMENDRVIGFAQMQSDGELQAHLSVIAVDKDYRGCGIARGLIGVALRQAGGKPVDPLTDSAKGFYSKGHTLECQASDSIRVNDDLPTARTMLPQAGWASGCDASRATIRVAGMADAEETPTKVTPPAAHYQDHPNNMQMSGMMWATGPW